MIPLKTKTNTPPPPPFPQKHFPCSPPPPRSALAVPPTPRACIFLHPLHLFSSFPLFTTLTHSTSHHRPHHLPPDANMFQVHDVVFARLEGYPAWPAQVIPPNPDHLVNLGTNKIPPNMRLVLFYNDGGKYALMDVSDLRPIDDPRHQKRTKEYKGQFHKQLQVAYKSALRDHSKSHNITPSSPSPSPTHRKRPKKTPSSHPSHQSHPTSPVTGHSDLRQSLLSQPPNPVPTKLATTSSRTHLPVSAATPSVPVKIRLRPNPPSTPSDTPLPSPHSHLSSPSPVQTLHQPSPKRRRLDTNTQPNYINQSQTEHSNHKRHDSPQPSTSEALAKPQIEQNKPHTPTDAPNKTEKTSPNMPIIGNLSRTPRSSSEQYSHCHETNVRKILRDPQKPARTIQLVPRLEESENNPHKTQRVGKSHLSPRVSKARLSNIDDDSMAKTSPNPARERQPDEIKNSRTRRKSRRGDDQERVQTNGGKREADSAQRPLKRRKTDESRESGSLAAFDVLSEKDSSEVIQRMINTIRLLHVEKWRDGCNRAGAGDMIKTEKEMWARCKSAIQKAEELLKIMESEGKEKLQTSPKELETFQALSDMREIYFDVKTMNLRKVGRKLMRLGRELEAYSTKVWSVIRDVLVLWADLTTECVNLDAQKGDDRKGVKKENSSSDRERREHKNEDEKKSLDTGEDTVGGGRKTSAEKGKVSTKERGKMRRGGEVADKKEGSAREERLKKFDRKTLLGAVETILKGVPEGLEWNEKERRRFTRELEEAIRPRLEEDRSGYYEASVKVMKGLRRALKDLKAHSMEDANKRTQGHTKMFVSAMHDEKGEKARLLVTRLLG